MDLEPLFKFASVKEGAARGSSAVGRSECVATIIENRDGIFVIYLFPGIYLRY
jgi:hypothetical protein